MSVRAPLTDTRYVNGDGDRALREQNIALGNLVSDQQAVIAEWKEKVTQASRDCEYYRLELNAVTDERDKLRELVQTLRAQIEQIETAPSIPRRATGHDVEHLESEATGSSTPQKRSPLKHSAAEFNLTQHSPEAPRSHSNKSFTSLDTPTKELAITISRAFDGSSPVSSGNETSSMYETANETDHKSSPEMPFNSLETKMDQLDIRDSDADAAHSRQTSSAFSWEATAQDEHTVKWASRGGQRDSLSSVEYVDDSEEEVRVADADATPTLQSTGSTTGFPKRVQSYFPSTARNLNAGLGVSGIEDGRLATEANDNLKPEEQSKASPILRLVSSNASSPQSQHTLRPEDSPVYFPPASPETIRNRLSSIPVSAVNPPSTSSTYYDNVPVIQPSSELITPSTLPTIAIQVTSSRMRNVQKSRGKLGDPTITLSIRDRSSDKEWWKVSKSLNSLTTLDSLLRQYLSEFSLPKLPDRSAFVSLAPSKADARRQALEGYFSAVTGIPALVNEPAQLFCNYLSTDIIDPMAVHDTGARKEGYLTKKGKSFGGWKVRYFVLDSSKLQYYDSPGGIHLGTIRLDAAEVTTQAGVNVADSGNKSYRHAFQIFERKRSDSGSGTKHVLCAESDDDRDDWVEALREYIEPQDVRSSDQHSVLGERKLSSGLASSASSVVLPSPKKKLPLVLNLPSPIRRKRDDFDNANIEVTDTATTIGGGEYDESSKSSSSSSPSPPGSARASTPLSAHFGKLISASFASSTSDLSRLDVSEKDLKRQKKRSFFSLKKDAEPELGASATSTLADQLRQQQQQQIDNRRFLQLDLDAYQNSPIYEYRASVSNPLNEYGGVVGSVNRNFDYDKKYAGEIVHGGIKSINNTIVADVFGVSLSQAIEISFISKGEVKLPSVMYRCIEYLDAKNAADEEGIFRLSGSSSVIRALKERFNADADVNLLDDGAHFDVHAVAGLLKLYLRELPNNVLTESLKPEFMQSLDIENRRSRLDMLHVLLRQLPPENFSVLKALSHYLTKVVEKSERNKMTIRNVGIVFAPTLNIANSLVQTFLIEYGALFVDKDN